MIPETSGHVDNGLPIDGGRLSGLAELGSQRAVVGSNRARRGRGRWGYEFKRAIPGPVNRPRSHHRPKA